MNLLGRVGMVFLVVINIFFLIAGISLLIGGAIMNEKGGAYAAQYMPLLENISIGSFKMGSLVKALAGFGVSLGLFAVVIAIIGIAGAITRMRLLLIIYGAVIIIILLLEFVALGGWFTFKHEMVASIKDQMLNLIQRYDGNAANQLTRAWNFLFLTFHCCGVNPVILGNDFVSSIWWLNPLRGQAIIPGHCCVGADPNTADFNINQLCTINPSTVTAYIDRGCYNEMSNIMNPYSSTFIAIGVVLVIIEICAVIAAFGMLSQMKNDVEYEVNEKK
ncbi:tetraspanin-9-like isoform X1 [Crassostrea angulata]|uniref:tetraspanin-9-like isoform X1 n=1 Tax=Magallana angulata TaxID=2784310 RepID=UPI00097512CC|nr:tetraspanin-9 isoform X1 [Crassostrea gigas]XP_052675113.1 tetraspanin-9-like isoform X1 [Crassostrea angulata]|eukprot:XP_019926918.1 PREDICTED: tetraspanin-9 isoform X2 [Crassostrea gigas]